jgi:hypothetical protein
MDYEDKKEELFDLCLEMRRTRAFKTMSWEDVQNLRLTTHLAAQVKPKPDDAIWYNLKHMKLYCSICFPSFIFFLISPAGADIDDLEASMISKVHTSVWDF